MPRLLEVTHESVCFHTLETDAALSLVPVTILLVDDEQEDDRAHHVINAQDQAERRVARPRYGLHTPTIRRKIQDAGVYEHGKGYET